MLETLLALDGNILLWIQDNLALACHDPDHEAWKYWIYLDLALSHPSLF